LYSGWPDCVKVAAHLHSFISLQLMHLFTIVCGKLLRSIVLFQYARFSFLALSVEGEFFATASIPFLLRERLFHSLLSQI